MIRVKIAYTSKKWLVSYQYQSFIKNNSARVSIKQECISLQSHNIPILLGLYFVIVSSDNFIQKFKNDITKVTN